MAGDREGRRRVRAAGRRPRAHACASAPGWVAGGDRNLNGCRLPGSSPPTSTARCWTPTTGFRRAPRPRSAGWCRPGSGSRWSTGRPPRWIPEVVNQVPEVAARRLRQRQRALRRRPGPRALVARARSRRARRAGRRRRRGAAGLPHRRRAGAHRRRRRPAVRRRAGVPARLAFRLGHRGGAGGGAVAARGEAARAQPGAVQRRDGRRARPRCSGTPPISRSPPAAGCWRSRHRVSPRPPASARSRGGTGSTPREVVAFGDMPNDLEMLRWAGHGVAMGNAHPALLDGGRRGHGEQRRGRSRPGARTLVLTRPTRPARRRIDAGTTMHHYPW